MEPDNTAEILEEIAKEMDIKLYRRFTESEASDILGLSIQTLRRIRSAGKISYLRVSERHVRFFGFQLCEYLLSNIEEKTCPDTKLTSGHIRSENTGSLNSPVAQHGAGHGSTEPLDKLSALRCAQQTFKKQKPG